MFKFLRKYNKYILAVGGTLLLITFLIPFAFTNLLQGVGRGGATWATVNDDQPTKVTVAELRRIQRELEILQYTAPQMSLGKIDRPEYWYLLQREAAQGGFIGTPSGLLANPQVRQNLAALAATSGDNVQFVAQTLAKVDGVSRMLTAYLEADRYSDRRLKQRARRMFHRVTVQPVVIEASVPQEPLTFTDQQLQEQMDTYAEDRPGEGDMGFGYRLPDRIKLEWLAVPAASVEAMIEASDQLNPVALRKHWRQEFEQAGRFGAPDPDAPVPDEVRSDLLSTLTERSLDEIARYANDQLRIARRGLAHRAGYLEIPEGWTGLSFETLALDIQDRFGVDLPAYHAVGDRWLSADDLAGLEGIGAASTDKFGDTPVDLSQFVTAARAFGGSPTIPIQQSVAGPPLRGDDGSVYLFRIIATDPSRPPESIDEVRDALVADLNRLADYERLVASVDGIRQVAVDEGLLALALDYDTVVRNPVAVSTVDLSTLFTPGPPQPTSLPVIGRNEATVSAIVDHAMALPTDKPLSDLPVADRTMVLPVRDRLAVLAALITRQSPLTEEQYRTYAQYGTIQGALVAEDLGEVRPLDDDFSFDALAGRHNFQLAAGEGETKEPDAQDEPDFASSG